MPAIRALRKARPALGIVAHAARPERHAATEAIGAGATAYVAKSSPAPVASSTAVDAAAEAEAFVDPARAEARGRTLTRASARSCSSTPNGLSTEHASPAPRRQHRDGPHPHQGRPLARLDARDRAHAVAIGLRNSLIE